jgi:hypothetical protein
MASRAVRATPSSGGISAAAACAAASSARRPAGDSIGGIAPKPDDCVGMIGPLG